MSVALENSFHTGELPLPGETQLTGKYPYYNVYETKDARFVSIGAMSGMILAASSDGAMVVGHQGLTVR